MADTQWKANKDGKCPNGVAVGVIKAINTEFIKQGVKFVIQVGDLTGPGDAAAMNARADAAKELYDAGIGFYPLRGNHEGTQPTAKLFQKLYPQTRNAGEHVFGACSFSSPFPILNGLSYAFDYNNARFVLLDQYTRTDNSNKNRSLQDTINDIDGLEDDNILDQLDWIDSILATRQAGTHAFVLAHKNLIDQNHVDTLFGKDPTANSAAQDRFVGSLARNGVHYLISGHDHMHHRAAVKSPDGKSAVQEIICASDSYKFYIPQKPSNDVQYKGATGVRETPIAQELGTIGFYIYTVDGPRVTVDFYSSNNGQSNNGLTGIAPDGRVEMVDVPALAFNRRETFGYSLNGQEFAVAQGESYSKVKDGFEKTSAVVLGGVNGSVTTEFSGRPLTKTVNTGWTPKTGIDSGSSDQLYTDIFSLWGMCEVGKDQTDTYALSMSYEPPESGGDTKPDSLCLATRDESGNLINAVDRNVGGTKTFVAGSWDPKYALGTYGVDASTHTAWAVINYNGDFAVADLK